MNNSNGNEVHTVKVKVEAKDRSGNILGAGECKQYAKTPEGLNAATKDLGIEKIITDLNRQIKTDVRNHLSRGGPSINKELKDVRSKLSEKEQAEFDLKLQAIKDQYS